MKCPKCHFDNLDDTVYCGKCATPLKPTKETHVSKTKTIRKPSEELAIGSTFGGKYEIIGELGRGGMGVVYEAEDTKLKRTVALKFLPPELTGEPEARERFVREAQAAAALDHPNICTVHEIDEAEGKTFIAMAYVDGQSLRRKIKQAPLKLDEALNIALQVAEGLEEAHKKGIVHRDIKSVNIMVTEKGQAKIMDFGLAKVVGGILITKEAKIMGTVAYMSPEQAQGGPIDHRTDIWSFGVVLYEMLSGQLPFLGEREPSVIHSIIYDDPKSLKKINPDVPEELEQVLGKALAKNPDKRYQKMDELLDDLYSISKGFVPPKIRAAIRRARLAAIKRVYLYGGIAALIVTMTVIALIIFPGRGEAIDSIAVLPLENLSGNPDQEYFTEAMHEALITELSKIRALKVISRLSVMRYRNSDKSLSEMAKELNVKAIVAGSALQEGERVRITVQLIDADTERNLWAEKYDKDYRDILVLYGEVALDIAQEIRIAVTPEERTRLTIDRSIDPEAYQLYLKGNYQLTRVSEKAFIKAIENYQKAIEKEPKYASAYAGLAIAYIKLGGWHTTVSAKEVYSKAKEAALKALELDDKLADAHMALGRIKYLFEWDWSGADAAFKRGVELNPSSTSARIIYANYLTAMGRLEESIAFGKQTLEFDPLSPVAYNELGFALQFAGNYDGALEQYRKGLELDPDFHQSHGLIASVYIEKGMHDEAVALCQKLISLAREIPNWLSWIGNLYARAGRQAEALKILNELKERSEKKNISSYIADVYLGLGDKEHALEWLEKAYDEQNINLVWLKVSPRYDPLRDNPRFQELLRRMNFPE